MHVNHRGPVYLPQVQSHHTKCLKKTNERNFRNSGGIRLSSSTEQVLTLITLDCLRITPGQTNTFILPWVWPLIQATKIILIDCIFPLTLKIHKSKIIQVTIEQDPSPSWKNKTKRTHLHSQHTHYLMITNLVEKDPCRCHLSEEV